MTFGTGTGGTGDVMLVNWGRQGAPLSSAHLGEWKEVEPGVYECPVTMTMPAPKQVVLLRNIGEAP